MSGAGHLSGPGHLSGAGPVLSPEQLVRHLREAGQTLATAESLTAGLVAAQIAEVPGASAVLRGGVVAYASEVKVALLGVPAELLDRSGAVDPQVACAMAAGARRACGSDWGAATTGVAGPGSHEGKPEGTVFVAVSGPGREEVRELALSGTRQDIRRQSVAQVLALLGELLEGPLDGGEGPCQRTARDL